MNFNLKELEKKTVIDALNYTKGNITFARELLGVSKATIYRLMRDYNIDYLKLRADNEIKSSWTTTKISPTDQWNAIKGRSLPFRCK